MSEETETTDATDVETTDVQVTEPAEAADPTESGAPSRAMRLLSLAKRDVPPKYKPWLFGAAVVIFLGVSAISFRSLPSRAQIVWWPLPVLVLGMSPLTLLAGAAEYRMMGVINGHSIRWAPAFRLIVLAYVVNLLPLPGGLVVRSEALHRLGSKYRTAVAANIAAFVTCAAVACVMIGSLLLAEPGLRAAGAVLLASGIVLVVGVAVLLHRLSGPLAPRYLAKLVVIEIAVVAVTGARIFLAFRLLGLSASAAQSIAVSGSSIIAAAVGIFPAGLGIREALAGIIGSAVRLSLFSTIAATASDRIVFQISLAGTSAVLAIGNRRHRGPTDAVLEQTPEAV